MTDAEMEIELRRAGDCRELLADSRPNRNASEAKCWDLLAERGWWIHKRGWPDFLCTAQTDDMRAITFCVEVKRHPEDVPREDQMAVMHTLEAAGIPCFMWDQYTGFRRVGSWPSEPTATGKQHGDTDCPDPSILRCVFCSGGGKSWMRNPEPVDDLKAILLECWNCGGTGLAVPRLAVAGSEN